MTEYRQPEYTVSNKNRTLSNLKKIHASCAKCGSMKHSKVSKTKLKHHTNKHNQKT